MIQYLKSKLAVIYGNHFSLDRNFKKNNAKANIFFVGREKPRSIRLVIGDITYFFEGKPEIQKYKNMQGDNVQKHIYKYGGWEIDLFSK